MDAVSVAASSPHLSSSSSEFTLRGETKIWRLRRIRVLGKGSYGLASLVEDLDTGEQLVSKDINLQCVKKASDLEDIMKEIKILKLVRHPNIVQFRDCCQDMAAMSMTIMMEYCDGGDLAQKLAQHQAGNARMSEDLIASILIQLLMALRYLHLDFKILHRDLKSANIFLTSAGVVKLGDFGVSTILGQSVEFAKTFCGSPLYLAPELCQEQPYDGKADLWSLGVVLYEMIALQRPFQAKNLVTLVLQITRAEYPPLGPETGVSSDLRDIAASLLQRLPQSRPTIRRLLRLPYTVAHVRCVPRELLATDEYDKHLNSRRLLHAGGGGGGGGGGGLDPEFERWVAADRQQLTRLEQQMGLRGDAFDPSAMSERQRREMETLSKASRREDSQAQGQQQQQQQQSTGTGGSSGATEEDELWNSKYADDDFEADEDTDADNYKDWKVMNTLPMREMSFSL